VVSLRSPFWGWCSSASPSMTEMELGDLKVSSNLKPFYDNRAAPSAPKHQCSLAGVVALPLPLSLPKDH